MEDEGGEKSPKELQILVIGLELLLQYKRKGRRQELHQEESFCLGHIKLTRQS